MVPGMCGVVDGRRPARAITRYEAGQSCVGDHFAWFVDNCVPAAYTEEADRQGKTFARLPHRAGPKSCSPAKAACSLWTGGTATARVLADVDLTGMMLGMTLATRPGGDLPRSDRSHRLRHAR